MRGSIASAVARSFAQARTPHRPACFGRLIRFPIEVRPAWPDMPRYPLPELLPTLSDPVAPSKAKASTPHDKFALPTACLSPALVSPEEESGVIVAIRL